MTFTAGSTIGMLQHKCYSTRFKIKRTFFSIIRIKNDDCSETAVTEITNCFNEVIVSKISQQNNSIIYI